MLQGYALYNPERTEAVIAEAREAGAQVPQVSCCTVLPGWD